MQDSKIIYGVVGFVCGVVITWIFAVSAVNNNNIGMMRTMGMRNFGAANMMAVSGRANWDMDDMMRQMSAGLQDKNGDDFDKTFLSEMIIHHQGAIDMATEALSSAKHQEIKDMARGIIDAQTTEISQMKAWQQAWYK